MAGVTYLTAELQLTSVTPAMFAGVARRGHFRNCNVTVNEIVRSVRAFHVPPNRNGTKQPSIYIFLQSPYTHFATLRISDIVKH